MRDLASTVAPYGWPDKPRDERPVRGRLTLAVMARARSVGNRILQVPLVLKLLGANSIIVVGALLAANSRASLRVTVLVVALGASFALSTVLVRLALRPLDELAGVARDVIAGNLAARAAILPTADAQIERLATALNQLLDQTSSDRAQIHRLIQASFNARERERAALASHLRESTAQQLAAVALQLAAVHEGNPDPALAPALQDVRALAAEATEDIRNVADSVYPGMMTRIGLYPALEAMARRAGRRLGVDVTVDTTTCQRPLPGALTTALYGVAEEALRNVERHARPTRVHVALQQSGPVVELAVIDDGCGFELVPAGGQSGERVGLFRARQLMASCGGDLEVTSSPGRGTAVRATAPLEHAA